MSDIQKVFILLSLNFVFIMALYAPLY